MGLDSLTDLRSELPTGPQAFFQRRNVSAINSVTLHYNGPPVALDASATPAQERAHLAAIARYHIGVIWGRAGATPIYGHGIMYHFAVFPSGRAYWLRSLDHVLWHCGNNEGNTHGLAVHYVAGTGQAPTAAGWASIAGLFALLMDTHHIPRSRVFGHTEWPRYQWVRGKLVAVPNSECPGPLLMAALKSWRAGDQRRRWRIRYADAFCREGPGRWFPIALNGQARYPAGHEFESDAVVQGERVGASARWLHRIDGIGFIHDSLVEEIPSPPSGA